MPLRTTTVVAMGLAGIGALGVTAIFGSSIVALASGRPDVGAETTPAAPAAATPAPAAGGAPGVPAAPGQDASS